MTSRWLSAASAAAMLAVTLTSAQIGRIAGQDWTTSRADAQRTSWIRSDAFISKESMTKPDFKLQWKLELGPQATALIATPAFATASMGFKPLTFFGSSNTFYAVDNETGILYWQKKFDAPQGVAPCAAGQSTVLGRTTMMNVTAGGGGRGGGGAPRGRGPFMGGVGEPGEGVPQSLMTGGMFGPGGGGPGGPGRAAAPGGADPQSTPAPPAGQTAVGGTAGGGGAGAGGAGGGPGGRGPGGPGGPAVPGGPGGGRGNAIYAIASDGVLRFLGSNSGKEVQRPVPFLPAGAYVSNLTVVENVAYALTRGGCGGAANGLWAVTVGGEANALSSWKTNGGNPVGAPAFSAAGLAYIAVSSGPSSSASAVADGSYSNAIVALDPKTMTVRDWFTQPSADFTSTPVVFKYKDKDIVAAGTRDGRILLFEAASLGGPAHGTPLHSSAPISTRGITDIATWEESGGTRWLIVPVAGPTGSTSSPNGAVKTGAIVGYKLTDADGAISLQPGWVSRDLNGPNLPVIVNGVVFAASGAVLYALDGTTGRELWTSGKTITSPVSPGALWTSVGQIHLATTDGRLYTFGFPLERY